MRKFGFGISSLSGLMCLAALLAAGQAKAAGEVSISVLGLEPAAGAPEQVAAAVTEALRQRATSTPGFRLIPGRDLVEVKLVFSCPDEAPACMTQAAQSIGATKILFGNVQPVGTDAYIVTLKLLDAERGVVETWLSEQISKAQTTPTALRMPVQKWFATLTGQSVPGTIRIVGGVVGATVWLDGVQAGLLGNDGLTIAGVAAGTRQVAVSKAGYEKWQKQVNLASGAMEKIQVSLKPIEEAGSEETAAEATVPAPIGAGVVDQSQSDMEVYNQGSRVGAWALLGLGMVGIGLGGYSSYKVGSVNSSLDPYRRFPCAGSSAQTCSADGKTDLGALTTEQRNFVDSQKSSGDNWSKVQWVGYGVGGALLVTSTVLFYHGYFSKPSSNTASAQRPTLVVLPSLAPNSAGALALVRF